MKSCTHRTPRPAITQPGTLTFRREPRPSFRRRSPKMWSRELRRGSEGGRGRSPLTCIDMIGDIWREPKTRANLTHQMYPADP